MGKFATIRLDLFKHGIRAVCEDMSDGEETYEEFIPRGDGNALMDFINDVEFACDPDTRYVLTEKARKEMEDGEAG